MFNTYNEQKMASKCLLYCTLCTFPYPYLYILFIIKAVTLLKLYKFFPSERDWRRWRRRVRGAGARWRVIFSIVAQIFRLQDLTYRQVQDGE
jgi:hypothetical protein